MDAGLTSYTVSVSSLTYLCSAYWLGASSDAFLRLRKFTMIAYEYLLDDIKQTCGQTTFRQMQDGP